MKRVLAVFLDAAEPSLIEKWTDDGSMPAMQRLRREGVYGRLASTADLLAGSSAVSFYTGQNPANHGFYNYLVWNPDRMATEVPDPQVFPLVPFWRRFGEQGPRPIVIDIPHTFAPEAPYRGVEVLGWTSHDSIASFATTPPDLGKRILGQYGGPFVSEEKYGPMTKNDFRSVSDEAHLITHKIQDLTLDLMKHEAWGLSLVCFPSIHRCGHRLLNLKNVRGKLSQRERDDFSEILHRVYMACDQAVGSFVQAAGDDATVMVFSLHGMDDNYCLTWILPEMLRRVLAQDASAPPLLPRTLNKIRSLVPESWRHYVKSRLPRHMRHGLTAYWRDSQMDWSKTQAFSMMADVQGLIRVNLRGREALGIVEPGAEYNRLCDKIMKGLETYVDADSGQPVIERVVRTDRVLHGHRQELLPDIILTWVRRPASDLRAVRSPLYGIIDWPTPGMHPEGRSGTHVPQGMLIAAGPGIKSGTISGAHILDLAPTILTLLGQPVPGEMEGKPIELTD